MSANFLQKKLSNKWCVYINSIIQEPCIVVLKFLKYKFLHSLSHTLSNPLSKTVYFATHASIRTNIITCIYTFFFQKSEKNPLQHSLIFCDLSGTYERARDAFRRCLALHSSNRQHQLRIPVEGLTSRTLLRECKGVPTSSLLHSLCAHKNLVREKRTAWERKTSM